MAQNRKITVYHKESGRNIVLTDTSPSETPDELKRKLLKLMASKKISILSTSDDMLIFRPSDVTSIMVSSKGEFDNGTEEIDEDDVVLEEDDDMDIDLEIEEADEEYKDDLKFEKE